MAKRAKAGDSPDPKTNLSETKQIIRDAVGDIIRIKAERKELNAEIAERRARVVNCGVPKAALDLAVRMREMDVADRDAIDEGYAIARDALGMGLQLSMFEAQDPQPRDEDEVAEAKNGKVTPISKPMENARAHLGGDTTGDAAA